jgi:predicted ATPase
MKRFILTGAPGAGKTAVIRQLELDGFSVVEEAATDIHGPEDARGVAEPWNHPSFIDSMAAGLAGSVRSSDKTRRFSSNASIKYFAAQFGTAPSI